MSSTISRPLGGDNRLAHRTRSRHGDSRSLSNKQIDNGNEQSRRYESEADGELQQQLVSLEQIDIEAEKGFERLFDCHSANVRDRVGVGKASLEDDQLADD